MDSPPLVQGRRLFFSLARLYLAVVSPPSVDLRGQSPTLKAADFSAAQFQRAFIYISGPYPMKALYNQGVKTHIRHCRGGRACRPASCYTNASSSALASWRSAVSK